MDNHFQERFREAQNLQNGTGTGEKDINKARDIYMELAGDGFVKAQIALGELNEENDVEEAVKWYKLAAGSGSDEALAKLGKLMLKEKDYALAAQYFSSSSKEGNLDSRHKLGILYIKGLGVATDTEKGLSLILDSASRGFVFAQYDAGYIYHHGICGVYDYEKAEYWYSEALKQVSDKEQVSEVKDVLSLLQKEKDEFQNLVENAANSEFVKLYNIARHYMKGKGVRQDYSKAIEYLRLAIEKGSPDAMCAIGWCYYNGNGVEKDLEKAFEWYLKAAEKGHSEAQNNVGWCYANGLGVAQNYAKAVEWYRAAADRTEQTIMEWKNFYADKVEKAQKKEREIRNSDLIQGNTSAQKNLAWCYQHHLGTSLSPAEADKEAFRFYRSAAKHRDAEAASSLAFFYKKGIGVEMDMSQAFAWYQRASEAHDATAHCNLGWFFESGKGGVKRDIEKAKYHYRQAAAKGVKKAQERLNFLSSKSNI